MDDVWEPIEVIRNDCTLFYFDVLKHKQEAEDKFIEITVPVFYCKKYGNEISGMNSLDQIHPCYGKGVLKSKEKSWDEFFKNINWQESKM